MLKLNENLGMAWVRNQQKPFLYDQEMKRGKYRGKLKVFLTRGRDDKGTIIKGKKIYIKFDDIIEIPEVLRGEYYEKSDNKFSN